MNSEPEVLNLSSSELLPEKKTNVRTIAMRWIFRFQLVLTSSAHLGSGESGHSDSLILRTPSGKALLSGTQLTGALRSHIADCIFGYFKEESADPALSQLFGSKSSENPNSKLEPYSSQLIINDSVAINSSIQNRIRDNVHIESATGLAMEHQKFDYEILPKGTTFPVQIEWMVPDKKDEAEMLPLVYAGLQGLSDGSIRIGAKKQRGLGSVRTDQIQVFRYDLFNAQNWVQYLSHQYQDFQIQAQTHTDFQSAIQSCLSEEETSTLELYHKEGERNQTRFRLKLSFEKGIIIHSYSLSTQGPDSTHLVAFAVDEKGNQTPYPILTGTSLAGAMRLQALRIAQWKLKSTPQAESLVNELFGYAKSTEEDQDEGSISRLRMNEPILHNAIPQRVTRIQIDRYSHKPVDHALFEDEPLYHSHCEVDIAIFEPSEKILGLFSLVLKDMKDGLVPLGGTAQIGRGIISTLEIEILDESGQIMDEPQEQFQKWIEAL